MSNAVLPITQYFGINSYVIWLKARLIRHTNTDRLRKTSSEIMKKNTPGKKKYEF